MEEIMVMGKVEGVDQLLDYPSLLSEFPSASHLKIGQEVVLRVDQQEIQPYDGDFVS